MATAEAVARGGAAAWARVARGPQEPLTPLLPILGLAGTTVPYGPPVSQLPSLPARPPGLPSLQEQVRRRIGEWRRIGTPPHILRWIQEGVRAEWIDTPPPPFHHGVSHFTPEERQWVTGERDRCLLTGAWRRATDFDFVSRAFIVEHNGKRRLVLNFAHVNEFHVKRKCRYESLSTLRRTMRPGDWLWSCDLADAYHHIGVHPDSQKYFTFALETETGIEYFSASALSFGWTLSPYVFSSTMKVIVSHLRGQSSLRALRHGNPSVSPRVPYPMRVLPWLDDFMFMSEGSLEQAQATRDFSFALFSRLGVSRNPSKGQPEPSHRLEDHLGYAIDSEVGEFQLTVRRELKLRRGALGLLYTASSDARRVPSRALASFAGLANSSGLAFPLARCWLRSAFDDLATQRDWRSRVRLSRQTMADIRQFSRLSTSPHTARPIWMRPDTAVGHVDAGPYGWGGDLDESRSLPPVMGSWSEVQAELHITHRELIAVRLFITHYVEALRGRRLLLWEDNQAVVAILTSLTSRSPALLAELRSLIGLLDVNDISLRALYIRSAENIVADHFSRVVQPREYAISPAIFTTISEWWGVPSVDAFASAATALVPRYWSERPTPGAEGTEAFAQVWSGERVWAHPPPHLLPQVAQFLRADPTLDAIVCAPLWPGSSWFSELLELSAECITFPAGSLIRVAFDGPALLESWQVVCFLVRPAL